jgi:hypothetical protein
MGFLGGFYLFILTRGWVLARATQPKTRLGRVAISQNPTQTRGLTSLNLAIRVELLLALSIMITSTHYLSFNLQITWSIISAR